MVDCVEKRTMNNSTNGNKNPLCWYDELQLYSWCPATVTTKTDQTNLGKYVRGWAVGYQWAKSFFKMASFGHFWSDFEMVNGVCQIRSYRLETDQNIFWFDRFWPFLTVFWLFLLPEWTLDFHILKWLSFGHFWCDFETVNGIRLIRF